MTLIRQSEGAKHFAVPAESQPGEESHTDDMEVEDHAEARQASMTFKLPDAVGSLDKDGLEFVCCSDQYGCLLLTIFHRHRLKDQEEKLSSMKPNMSSIEEYAIADGNYKVGILLCTMVGHRCSLTLLLIGAPGRTRSGDCNARRRSRSL